MNPSKEALDAELVKLENEAGMEEYEIRGRLSALREDDSDCEPCKEWRYEMDAFHFSENYYDAENEWGTYFGPAFMRPTQDGMIYIPDIESFDEDTISYWSRRASATNNPRMKARYAGLVWDFSEKVSGERADYQIAQTYVDSLLKIAPGNYYRDNLSVIAKLKRALSVAISLNDTKLQERAKFAILEYEDAVAVDTKPGLWGFGFDLLVVNKKISLTADEERKIICALEERMERLGKEGHHWECEPAAERLITYYDSKGKKADCTRVVKTLGLLFEEAADAADPLRASGWLEHIRPLYVQYGLRKEAEQVSRKIRQLGPKVRNSMQAFSSEVELSPEQLDEHLESIDQGSADETLKCIAVQYLPKRKNIEEQLRHQSGFAPLTSLLSMGIVDHKGRVMATVGSVESDLDGRVVMQISENMRFECNLLEKVFDHVIEKYNLQENSLLEYLYKSPIFPADQEDLLRAGLRSYFNGDYAPAIHLIVPQIEATLRSLVENFGGNVLKRNSDGGFNLIGINELLKTDQARKMLGDDAVTYVRVVLSNPRGWNIRNNVCHGISPSSSFSRMVADRVLHILLLLAQIRKKGE